MYRYLLPFRETAVRITLIPEVQVDVRYGLLKTLQSTFYFGFWATKILLDICLAHHIIM